MSNLFPPAGLFADRDTLQEAFDYLSMVVEAMPKKNRLAAYTASYVLYNTTAKLANAEIAKRDARIAALEAEVAELKRRALPNYDPDTDVAFVWCIEDVLAERPDLTEDQAMQVLDFCERRHDATIGMNWDVINVHADHLFPEKDNV